GQKVDEEEDEGVDKLWIYPYKESQVTFVRHAGLNTMNADN
ncbi:6229_t:CDS:2, partial [Funneliformis geosporum]